MRKLVVFLGGAIAGASSAGYAKRRVTRSVQRTAERLSPVNVVRRAGDGVRSTRQRVGNAIREGRDAGRVKEAELRAERDGTLIRLDETVAPGDEVLVDGAPVHAGRVVVLRRQRHS